MRLKYLLPVATIFFGITASALDITTTEGGTLAEQLGDNKTITTLKINGPVNAVDFEYISGTLKSLSVLDLSDATITAVSGVKTTSGASEFQANELPQYALFGTGITDITLPGNITAICEGALGKTAIKSITIPASITTIGNYAFAGCSSLAEITVPSTVTNLGAGVWKECVSLGNATIYSRLETIGDNMFDGCVSLSAVTLQPSYKSIGNSSFAGCTSLSDFTFPATLVSIGDKAFYNSGLTAVNLNNCAALATIGDFGFAKCAKLINVTMGNSSTALGKGIFFDDTALARVQLPASTSKIPSFTFKGTASIDADNTLPEGTREIGDYALYGWENAEELLLPRGVSHIGTGAMEGWSSLKKLGAENLAEVPSLGKDVWAGVNQPEATLYVKDSAAEEQFKAADQWKDFRITIGTTGADNIIDDVTGENGSANVDFTVGDGWLRVQSHGAEIARVNIYDLTGRTRHAAACESTTLTVNTSQWRGSVLVAEAVLADGTRATIKLSI